MYKAVFIDMDGTLLKSDHTVGNHTKQVIQQLIQQGVLVVPISARPLHGMTHITDSIFPNDTPVVSLNGSYIWHNNSIIYQVHVSLPEADAIHAVIENEAVSAMYYSQMNWYAKAHTDAIKKEQKITPVPITLLPFDETLAVWEQQQTGPNKILIAGNPSLILTIETAMLEKFGDQLNIYKSQPRYLELMHRQASKAGAIQLLMDRHGLQQHEIIAIGDNYNDMGMIEFAGVGVAMGNAPEAIKKVANYVTDTNNHDGVAKALQHFFYV